MYTHRALLRIMKQTTQKQNFPDGFFMGPSPQKQRHRFDDQHLEMGFAFYSSILPPLTYPRPPEIAGLIKGLLTIGFP